MCSDMSNKKRVPNYMKKLRMNKGWSTYDLADKFGVNNSTIYYWENSIRFPKKEYLMQLEDFFNLSYRELFKELSEEEIKSLEKLNPNQKKTHI